MKYSFVLPLLSLASSVIAAPAPAVVTETSVVLVTANGEPTSSTLYPTSSAAAPQVGRVYEVIVSEYVQINGDNTETSRTTYTKAVDATSASSEASAEPTLSQADRAVVSTVDEISSTAQETSTSQSPQTTTSSSSTSSSSSSKETTTLQPSTTSKENTSTSSSSTSTSAAATSSSGTDSDFASAILKAHNDKRSQDGASALTWSSKLEEYAQAYADKYDCSGSLTHSGGQYGENLGLGYSTTGVVDAWYDEKSYYNSASPAASHFTQVVWKSTTQLGCAKKECGSYWGQYTICSYDPAGNMAGEYAENVQ